MNEIEVAVNCDLMNLINQTYPISFIILVGFQFGAMWSFAVWLVRIRSLERQLGVSKIDVKKR